MFGCGAVVLFTMTKTTQFQGVRGVLKWSAEKGEQRLVLVYGEAKTRIIRGRELESFTCHELITSPGWGDEEPKV